MEEDIRRFKDSNQYCVFVILVFVGTTTAEYFYLRLRIWFFPWHYHQLKRAGKYAYPIVFPDNAYLTFVYPLTILNRIKNTEVTIVLIPILILILNEPNESLSILSRC